MPTVFVAIMFGHLVGDDWHWSGAVMICFAALLGCLYFCYLHVRVIQADGGLDERWKRVSFYLICGPCLQLLVIADLLTTGKGEFARFWAVPCALFVLVLLLGATRELFRRTDHGATTNVPAPTA